MGLMIVGIVLTLLLTVGIAFIPDASRDGRPTPKSKLRLLYIVPAGFIGIGFFTGFFFWAEPGFKYHVRTITGEEVMVQGSGFKPKVFGRVNAWKNSISVQSRAGAAEIVSAEEESEMLTASIPAKRVIFLDQADARVSATARFELPSDQEAFLRLVRDFRTPDNMMRTELVPAFQETIEATANLMSAEEYFSGGRSTFVTDFEDQLRNGIYQVRRNQVIVEPTAPQGVGTANAALDTEQETFGDNQQVIYEVEKILDAAGIPRRKEQSFNRFGIKVVSARIIELEPNSAFKERMDARQDASARRAVAREERIEEEEQRLLAITKGERRVAEQQAETLVVQIKQTTQAETEKQLAITDAERQLESERILKDQAAVALERARLEAAAVKVKADAEAYAKAEIIKADNALQAKLDAEVEIQKAYAAAFAQRKVPSVYMAGAEGEGSEATDNGQALMAIVTAMMAQNIDYDRKVSN